jgi:ribonuclease HII
MIRPECCGAPCCGCLMPMLKPYHTAGLIEAGCDEAGRGCIAGPVFAAAVILPADFREPLLDDSKKLSIKTRDLLRGVIEREAIAFGVGVASEQEIDRINILNASILAMHRALDKLVPSPEYLLVDGNRFKSYDHLPFSCIIRGDGIFASIAAASILAKTHRDAFMLELHREYPHYGWDRNRGYPTREHRKAILKFGPSGYHRRSFRLLDEQMNLDFSTT